MILRPRSDRSPTRHNPFQVQSYPIGAGSEHWRSEGFLEESWRRNTPKNSPLSGREKYGGVWWSGFDVLAVLCWLNWENPQPISRNSINLKPPKITSYASCLFKKEMAHDVVQLDFGVLWHLGSFCCVQQFLLGRSPGPQGILHFGFLNVAKRLGTNKEILSKHQLIDPK